MRYTYSQSSGDLRDGERLIGIGYSGFQAGKNNPVAEDLHEVGPIPCGAWRIGPMYDDPELGPAVMALSPEEGTETFGRSGFFIHGDSKQHPGYASHGCIVLPRYAREEIAESGEKQLEVVA